MSVDALLVAIIGPQGSGKTTFINLASGSNLKVGSGLKSCTMEVAPTAPFSINGQEVVLLDTPGFDNTKTSDFDILEEVAQYMTRTYVSSFFFIQNDHKEIRYKKGKPLDGILYFHNITDRGVGGIAARNLSLFERLCGDDPLKSVVVVTNMWSLLPREELGDVRERELKEDVDSFGPVLGMGATLMRHKDTIQSSHNIISLLLIARERRRIVAIQTKMLCNLLCLEPVSATSVLTQDIHAKEEEPVQDDGSEASAPEEGTKIKRYDDTQESAKSSIPSLHPVRASKQLTRRFPPPIQIGDYELLMFMGRTTARKTILTNLATRSNLRVGSDMRGYNKEVISTTPFSTDEKELVVIRRSGFDGTGTSDLDIVGGMIQHLAKAYKRNPSDWRLYSYKIADRRAIGIGVCNSRLFEDTCGDDSLDSVVIATNMWQSSPNMGLGVVRQEVAKGPGFFSRVTQRDGALMIHANTRRSTSSILSLLLVEDGREILALQVGIGNDKPWLDQPPTASVITRLSDTRRKKHVEGSWFMVSTVESGIQRHGGTKKSIERTAPLPLPWPHNIRPTRRSSYPTQVQYPQTYRLITDGSLVVPRTLSLKQWDVMERRKVGVFVLSALSSGVSIWRCDDMKGSVKRHVPSSFPAKALTQPAHHSSSPMKMQDTQDRLLIAVLGPTGSGKSAFINLARDSSMEVDFGPKTCTTKVTPTTPFSVNGKEVVLLDTPGFDDTKISASDVLEEIAHYMARVYQRKKLLDGILYFHNIATTGIEKMVVPNLRLLTTLCGDDPLKSVVVVTNMWGLLPNTALGIERQKELVEDPSFVGRIIKGGATLMSHTNTKESSHNILSLSLLEGERRKILALQAKMGNDAPRLDQNPTVSVATRLLDTKRKKRIGGGVCMVTAPENGGRIQTTPNTKEFAERAIPSSLPAQATTGPTHHPRSPRRIQDPEV
ncbi:hypothetical protein CPB86DRAFT_283689 [Serendipita vermifera]|nr:hypothetical protein CPB86DRAFT_283689 [Serendipita vermifera]